MSNTASLPVLPDNVLELKGEQFFEWIHETVGEALTAILKIQLIDSTQVLINCADPFDVFKYDSPDINRLRGKVYFKTSNGGYIMKTGVKTNFYLLITSLNEKRDEKKHTRDLVQGDEASSHVINNYPMLKALFNWYEKHSEADGKDQSFLASLIDTITSNLTKSPNNYRFSESVEQFAMSLYILGGKMTYLFVRMNLSPALPSITTLNKLILNSDSKVNEGEFRFDLLCEYFHRIDSRYAFGSEDCTGVVRRISYDQATNSFIGFATPSSNGIPIAGYYQTDSFDQLKSWFASVQKSPLLNIHMIQPLPSSGQKNIPSAFLLSGYGVVNTYTSIEIIRRWLFIFDECSKRNIRIIGFSTGTHLFASSSILK